MNDDQRTARLLLDSLEEPDLAYFAQVPKLGTISRPADGIAVAGPAMLSALVSPLRAAHLHHLLQARAAVCLPRFPLAVGSVVIASVLRIRRAALSELVVPGRVAVPVVGEHALDARVVRHALGRAHGPWPVWLQLVRVRKGVPVVAVAVQGQLVVRVRPVTGFVRLAARPGLCAIWVRPCEDGARQDGLLERVGDALGHLVAMGLSGDVQRTERE